MRCRAWTLSLSTRRHLGSRLLPRTPHAPDSTLPDLIRSWTCHQSTKVRVWQVKSNFRSQTISADGIRPHLAPVEQSENSQFHRTRKPYTSLLAWSITTIASYTDPDVLRSYSPCTKIWQQTAPPGLPPVRKHLKMLSRPCQRLSILIPLQLPPSQLTHPTLLSARYLNNSLMDNGNQSLSFQEVDSCQIELQ